jgi:hypothetical protein
MHKKYRYFGAFIISALIFGGAIFISDIINASRIENVRTIQENIAIDILSLETQFELLQELSCKDIKENTILSKELSNLSQRLSYTEQQLGAKNDEVTRLKRQYSLLEIKDLLLMKKVSDKCKLSPVFILYFYSNKENSCDDCEKQGYVLTALSEKYPQLRIYSFDYDLDLPALQTLVKISDVPSILPALVINDTIYQGYQSVETIEALLPELEKQLKEAQAAAETTDAKIGTEKK